MIKKSFTMIELIFVIVIISIIAVVVSPKFCGDACGRNSDLVKAANQVLSHIRYVRHLAMIDNKFVPNPVLSSYPTSEPFSREKDSRQWFKKWWQIYFFSSDHEGGYAIFSDTPNDSSNNNYDAVPNEIDEVAKDPLTGKHLISYDYNSPTFKDIFLEKMDLKKFYSVNTINVNGCPSNSKHILFDNFGRPHCSKSKTSEPSHSSLNPYDAIATTKLVITLQHENTDEVYICIEPETGYAYSSFNSDCS